MIAKVANTCIEGQKLNKSGDFNCSLPSKRDYCMKDSPDTTHTSLLTAVQIDTKYASIYSKHSIVWGTYALNLHSARICYKLPAIHYVFHFSTYYHEQINNST